jgi:hypothetical protein
VSALKVHDLIAGGNLADLGVPGGDVKAGEPGARLARLAAMRAATRVGLGVAADHQTAGKLDLTVSAAI